ncbi:MAG: hypothetical protein JOY80_09695 [Candidatus Dormibacteraeota bacterium]|nr:hypothetical protein [Candidatus Dormibacteraeota bacterium]
MLTGRWLLTAVVIPLVACGTASGQPPSGSNSGPESSSGSGQSTSSSGSSGASGTSSLAVTGAAVSEANAMNVGEDAGQVCPHGSTIAHIDITYGGAHWQLLDANAPVGTTTFPNATASPVSVRFEGANGNYLWWTGDGSDPEPNASGTITVSADGTGHVSMTLGAESQSSAQGDGDTATSGTIQMTADWTCSA